MVKVAPLPLNFLMGLGKELDGLLAALAPLLAASDTPLGLPQRLLRFPIVAWVLHDCPIGSDEEHAQANVNARIAARLREGGRGYLGTRDACVPAIHFPRDGD